MFHAAVTAIGQTKNHMFTFPLCDEHRSLPPLAPPPDVLGLSAVKFRPFDRQVQHLLPHQSWWKIHP